MVSVYFFHLRLSSSIFDRSTDVLLLLFMIFRHLNGNSITPAAGEVGGKKAIQGLIKSREAILRSY